MNDVLFKNESFKIIGACLEVHNYLGCGFLESVYQEALEKEFLIQGIPFEKEKELTITYKKEILDKKFRVDFLCYNTIILELKALSSLTTDHDAQVLNYLNASGLKLGIIVNFGKPKLESKRLVL